MITKLIIPFTDNNADKDGCGEKRENSASPRSAHPAQDRSDVARELCRARLAARLVPRAAEIYKLADRFGVNTSTQVIFFFFRFRKSFQKLLSSPAFLPVSFRHTKNSSKTKIKEIEIQTRN